MEPFVTNNKVLQKSIYNFNKSIYTAGIFFLILIIYPMVVGYKENVEAFMVGYQLIIGVSFLVGLIISTKIKSEAQLLFLIFTYNIFFSVLLRLSFYDFYNLPFGEAVDSYNYDDIACKYSQSSLVNFWHDYNELFNLDDFGFSSFVIILYKIFGPNYGREILVLINSVFTLTSSYYFYKTLLLFELGHFFSRIGSALWGLFPFLFVTSSVGLKENIFCTLIVWSIYYIQKFTRNHTRSSLFKALIFILSTFFFRFVISMMLLIYLTINIISNSQNSKRVLIFIFCSSIIAVLTGAFVLQAITGISMESVLATAEYRSGNMDSAVSGQSIQLISALFGPFPNFTRYVQYGIYHSGGLLYKDILSLFCIWGIFLTFRKFNYRFYGISFYYLMGTLMLVVGGVALDMRYAITFYPAFIVLTILGIKNFKMPKLAYLFDLCIFMLILLYNQR